MTTGSHWMLISRDNTTLSLHRQATWDFAPMKRPSPWKITLTRNTQVNNSKSSELRVSKFYRCWAISPSLIGRMPFRKFLICTWRKSINQRHYSRLVLSSIDMWWVSAGKLTQGSKSASLQPLVSSWPLSSSSLYHPAFPEWSHSFRLKNRNKLAKLT